MTEDQLERLEQLLSAATAGPWAHRTERASPPPVLDDPAEWEVVTPAAQPHVILASELEPADAAFIVAAKAYLPDLIAELRRCREHGRG